MHFTMSHTTSLLCVSYLDHLSQIVTNIREMILQTTRVFFRRAWWKEVGNRSMKRPLGYFRILPEYSQNTFFECSRSIPRNHFWNTLGVFHGSSFGILQEYSTGALLEYSRETPQEHFWNTLGVFHGTTSGLLAGQANACPRKLRTVVNWLEGILLLVKPFKIDIIISVGKSGLILFSCWKL